MWLVGEGSCLIVFELSEAVGVEGVVGCVGSGSRKN